MRSFPTTPDAAVRAARRAGTFTLIAALVGVSGACDSYGDDDDGYGTGPQLPAAQVVSGSGDIAAKITEFQGLLGGAANGSTVGQQASGHRQVNWDGVPAAVTNTNTFPGAFFNTNVTRGLVTSTPGTGFRISDNDFADLSPTLGDAINAFSNTKTFVSVGSNLMDVTFQVAGSPTPAEVSGFAVVFSDVDLASSTKMEYFDRTGRSIGTFPVPVRSDAKGFSFLGVKFADVAIARVRITVGQAAPAAGAKDVTDSGGALDIVATDDFFYGEPKAIQ